MRINRAIIVLSLIIVQLSHFVYADDIKGTVSDKGSGDFLPGANIFLEGTNFGSSSDRAGNYSINGVPDCDYTLIVTTLVTVIIQIQFLLVLMPSLIMLR